MNVAITENYVVGCAECCAEVENITRAAIRDMSVSKVTLIPGHRHCHEVEQETKRALTRPAKDASAPTPLPPSGELFVEGAALNGFDHARE